MLAFVKIWSLEWEWESHSKFDEMWNEYRQRYISILGFADTQGARATHGGNTSIVNPTDILPV